MERGVELMEVVEVVEVIEVVGEGVGGGGGGGVGGDGCAVVTLVMGVGLGLIEVTEVPHSLTPPAGVWCCPGGAAALHGDVSLEGL